MTRGDRGRGRETEAGDPRPWRGRGWDLDSTCHIHSSDPHSFTVRGGRPPTQTTKEDDEPSLPEPDPMPWPPINNPLLEGEKENITMEEELARQAGRIYLHRDGGNR
ncbi:hypothetical protein PIB30_066153 [Stylosanthes scabra]|uniref:Uncharacterized protein n=1 Tax=Stylosanthes scabra TaxID=79078 RepID=A0ABU6UKZ2_9FABA|nr:hypothetical protein [Stylosanthes scabra]